MEKTIKRNFLEGNNIDLIMLALNATKIQSSPRTVTFILALNEAINSDPNLSMQNILNLFKVIFKEESKQL